MISINQQNLNRLLQNTIHRYLLKNLACIDSKYCLRYPAQFRKAILNLTSKKLLGNVWYMYCIFGRICFVNVWGITLITTHSLFL